MTHDPSGGSVWNGPAFVSSTDTASRWGPAFVPPPPLPPPTGSPFGGPAVPGPSRRGLLRGLLFVALIPCFMLTLIVGPQMLGEESGYEDVVHALQPAGVVAVSIEVTVTVLPDTRTGQAFIGSVEAVVTTPSGGLETVRLQDIGDDVTVPNRPGVYPSSAVPCHCGFDVPLMVRYLPGDPGTAMAEATYQSERAHLPTDILRAAVLEALGGTVLVSAAVLGLWRAMRRQAAPPPGPTAGARARPGRRRRRFWTCVLSAVLALACLELIPLTATSRVRGSAVAGTATLVTLAFLSLLLAWWARRRSRIRRPAAPARRLPLPRFPLTSGRPR